MLEVLFRRQLAPSSTDQSEYGRSDKNWQRRWLRHCDVLCKTGNELVACLGRVLPVPEKVSCRCGARGRRSSSKRAGVTRIGRIGQAESRRVADRRIYQRKCVDEADRDVIGDFERCQIGHKVRILESR
jgi:hypothetical protein